MTKQLSVHAHKPKRAWTCNQLWGNFHELTWLEQNTGLQLVSKPHAETRSQIPQGKQNGTTVTLPKTWEEHFTKA